LAHENNTSFSIVMDKRFVIIASILMLFGIILGALGAHGFSEVLDAKQMVSYKTAVRYQQVGAILLLIQAILMKVYPQVKITIAAWVFLAGVLFFSGSIYLLVFKDIIGTAAIKDILWPLTPLGGILMAISWFIIIVKFWRS